MKMSAVLGDLDVGARFVYNEEVWEKGSTWADDTVKCYPLNRGIVQWQLGKDLPKDTEVALKVKGKGE